MSGNTNFPTALDDNTSLGDLTDGVSAIQASDHNNLKEAVKAIEAKIGIYSSGAPTSLDYRLGNPTGGHDHGGASGMGGPISASALGGLRQLVQMFKPGSLAVGSNLAAPVILGRTLQLESVQGALRRGPSGATTAVIVRFGPSAIYGASPLYRPIFPPGATAYRSSQTPNVITYPSGAIITMDSDAVGSSDPGQDLSLTFVFRE